MKHLDYIGIAVKNLEQAITTYEKLLATSCYKRELSGSKNRYSFFSGP